MTTISITNWAEFQHYKDRCPPWIKLHQEILTSRTWVCASADDRVLAVAIMLLASRHDNEIPLDLAYIQRAAYLPELPDLQYLQDVDFITVNNGTLADASECLRNASTSPSLSSSKKKVSKSKSYKKRAKQIDAETLPEDWAEYCKTKRPDLDPDTVFEDFRDYYLSHGKLMVDWKRTWQRWVRNERQQAKEPRTSAVRPRLDPAGARPGETWEQYEKRAMREGHA